MCWNHGHQLPSPSTRSQSEKTETRGKPPSRIGNVIRVTADLFKSYYELCIEISRTPSHDGSLLEHFVKAAYIPSKEQNQVSRRFAEETLKLDIANMTKDISLEELQIELCWRSKHVAPYKYRMKFGMTSDLPFSVVFGKYEPWGFHRNIQTLSLGQ
jgi:hypothetical protein